MTIQSQRTSSIKNDHRTFQKLFDKVRSREGLDFKNWEPEGISHGQLCNLAQVTRTF